ncbi:MAG: UTP--glucose-1-phosphate uridylyltransferase, partial [Candidatus Omnitrophota bacterium]
IKLAEQAQEEFKKGNLEAMLEKKDRQARGHGDFFDQLIASGKLIEIYDQGIEVISVRNIDNIGARFDRYFLRTLGFFLEHKLDFQGEVTPRAPGQRGGNLIIRTDTDNRVFLEDPILRATVDLNGTPIVSPSDSYWLNSAVGLFTKHYVISLYKESNQTDDQFIENLRRASPEQRVTIAAKGRDRSPVMFDAKPGKGTVALTTKPAGESNLWMSTTAAPDDVKIGAIGVRGVRNLPLEKLSDMSIAELKEVLAPVRFVSAKQWVMSPEKRAAALVEFKKQIGPEVSDEKLDVMLNYILETYEGNKPLVDVLFELVFKGERFVKKEMFDASEGNKVKKVDSSTGGIDFDPAQLNLKIERTGAGMKVTVDPAELQRIKSDGVSGFRPVILNITPVKSLLPS